ncbi:hypothetical protein FGIG_03725 [Fasciola gigantica]|uniref:NADPH-dependent FMN reductase-like domain-containing protein n=1 Tax=Fasciola gigantica TaxID=46835 RepID=A0A504YM88_FASGI|nr:hypothetical protein FGIG_03725 [Fasciola gigantica]
MAPLRVLLFASSVRPHRMNDRVLKLVEKRLKLKGYSVRLIDPKELQLPILDKSISEYTDEAAVPDALKQFNEQVKNADMLFFTTCEYNRCVPPALSNMLSYLPHKTMAYKTAGLIAYTTGLDGGQLAASQLRLCLTELGCLLAPHSAILYNVGDRVSADGEPIGSELDCEAVVEEIDLIIEQVEYLSNAIRSIASQSPPPKVHTYV